ncbi:MAG TPA: hypothetical protein VLJ86_10000 [Ramlibacter sp.]|nr:hypothetical protein [Ramlibacter sp.]
MTPAFIVAAADPLGGSDFRQALRRVPGPLLHAMMACAVLLALAPQALRLLQTDASTLATPGAPATAERAQPASRTRCQGCGVVEGLRLVPAAADVPETYEFTVRLHDGSLRTSVVAGKSSWRVGDRIILMGGDAAR